MTEAAATATGNQIVEVALASIVGSMIEQHDFLVTGAIAAVLRTPETKGATLEA